MERPIFFRGPMVRAILDRKKTMTRRGIKPQPVQNPRDRQIDFHSKSGKWLGAYDPLMHDGNMWDCCPYGQPGDTLWVRETWASSPFRNIIKPRDLIPGSDRIEYRATYPNESHYSWRPSIHMPRWASRINLLVKSVRVERLQDISEEDAMAEGINPLDFLHMVTPTEVKTMKRLTCFELAWDSIYGKKYPWESNAWVWVVGFEIAEVKP